jgi:hypothetical protein
MAHTVIKSTLPTGTYILPTVNVNSAYGKFTKSVIDDVWDNNYAGKYTDIAIGGKLVNVNIKLSNFDTISLNPDAIKWRVADHLVKYMIENKLIEFTKQDNPIDNSTTINARCYLAPDDTVRILRQMTPNA